MVKSILGLSVLLLVSIVFFLWTGQESKSRVGCFGGVSLRLEYALTEAERERGLGGRATLPDDYGMLFVFPHHDYYAFWMKDTLIPLDIFWLDDKGQVVYIAPDVATSSYPNVFKPTIPARYVLETRSGFAKEHHILLGTPLLLQKFPTVLK